MADSTPRRSKRKGRPEKDGADAMQAGYAKAEAKNQVVRESLEPLRPGERPGPVTIGAILSTIAAILLWGSWIYAAVTGAKAGGQDVNLVQLAFFAIVLTMMAWGMWRARYWAVLGFQMGLVLLIIGLVLGMVTAGTMLQIAGSGLLVVALSVLFWRMIKAMARIQMPDRPGGH